MAAIKPSPSDVTLAGLISKLTGLNVATVLTWITAENGPATNRLGIMNPATHTLEAYPTLQAQAQAVSANLHTPTYAAVLSSGTSTADQLQAIAESPWDAGHYTGGQGSPKPGVSYGATLVGAAASLGYTLTSIVGGSPHTGNPIGRTVQAAANAPENAVKSVGNAIGAAATGAEGWLVNESAKALAYVVLTVLGIGLVFFGLLDTFGYSPRRVAGAVAGAVTPKPPVPGEGIPF